MALPVRDQILDPPLPTDVTGRTAIYRRSGIIASLLVTGFAIWWTRRQLALLTRRYRRLPPQDLPDYLRADLGLPPAPSRLTAPPPWEQYRHWK